MSEEGNDIKIENEVQYIYDDEEFILGSSLGEAVGENAINDYYLPDGTKAILVDGQYYIPADSQAIVFQEGQDDLNSYIINQDCDSIILGEDQETNEQPLDAPEYIQYVEGAENEGQQIIYYTSADPNINLDEYETAETFVDQEGQFEGLQELQDDSTFAYTEFKPIEMKEIVDIEELVRQQNGESQIVLESAEQEDARQYRYAVLKDGKLHIQSTPMSMDDLQNEDYDVSQTQIDSSKESQIVDLSQITGRNLITGQTVTLHDYMAKLQKKINKNPQETTAISSIVTKTNEPVKIISNYSTPVTNSTEDCVIPNKTVPLSLLKVKQPRPNRNIGEREKKLRALKSLLNTTIPIGKTTNGKRIVGKIVHVETKNKVEEDFTENVIDITDDQDDHQFEDDQEQYHTTLSDFINSSAVQTTLGISQENNVESPQWLEMIDENNVHTEEVKVALSHIDESSTISDDILQRIQYIGQEQEEIIHRTEPEGLDIPVQKLKPVRRSETDPAIQKISAITKKLNLNMTDVDLSSQNLVDMQLEPGRTVKIIVKNHKISKECYDDICKTLSGLMEMATVQKKLTKKNLAVKVIEKKYNSKDGKILKSAFHVYGYMAMELQFGSGEEIVEKWRFIPDKNTQDALLTDEVVQEGDNQIGTKTCKYIETVVLTLLMNYDKTGKRSIKVILNPSSGNKCSICTKEFKNYSQAQLHMTKVHNVDGSQTRCNLCQAQFEDVASLEKHKEAHIEAGKLIRCTFCKETFTTSARLYRHVAQHVPLMKPLECSLCHLRCSNESSLKKHLLVHTGIKLYKCVVCDKKYSNRSDLSEHHKVHNPMKFFVCEICSRKFTRLSNLVRHHEIHKKNGKTLFSCELCGASYCFSSSLTRHMVQNHINATSS